MIDKDRVEDDLPIEWWIKAREEPEKPKPKRAVTIYPHDEACDNPRRSVSI